MTTFDEYAHDRSAIEWLSRQLLTTIDADVKASTVIICEEVPRSNSRVSQESLRRILAGLELWENEKRTAMNRFQMVDTGLPAFLTTPTPETAKTDGDEDKKDPTDQPTKRKPKRRA